MDILTLMPESEAPNAAASWTQLEHIVERLHAAARDGLPPRDFYRRLLADSATAVGAVGGAAWLRRIDGSVEVVYEFRGASNVDPPPEVAERRSVIQRALADGEPRFLEAAADDTVERDAGPTLIYPVADSAHPPSHLGALEFRFPMAAPPPVQQGWLEFVSTMAAIAADFQALDELRRLRESAGLHREAVDLLRRVQTPRDLAGVAFEIANEGRRALGCDRVSVTLRRGAHWRLLSTSGVSQAPRGSDFARRVERLAERIADWAEPVFYGQADAAALAELPSPVVQALEQHLDQSHARELAAVPIALHEPTAPNSTNRRSGGKYDAVFIAERFAAGDDAWRSPLVDLAELCGPALARAAALDRFPIRTAINLANRLATISEPGRAGRKLAIVGAIVALLATLVVVPAEFNVEAPATLHTAVERDVFATATGAVAEVRVAHGDHVKQGDVLIVLHDPELALKLQQVRGEIDATRKRLDALAVSRTDRTLRDREGEDRLPLSAEQRQFEVRVTNLEAQARLLDSRRAALTIRSPIAGQVLTQDVQSLLESRPVERGQVLLTIADAASGWEVVADVPQRQVGHVVAAHAQEPSTTAASIRLAGDVAASYAGRVVGISPAVPLDAEGLEDPAAPVAVRIALTGDPPAAARPGMAAAVRIHCGKRPLGYIWLYDVAATLYRWLTF